MVFDIKPDRSILRRLHASSEVSHPCEVFDVAELLPLGWGVCRQQQPMDNGELLEVSETMFYCKRSCFMEWYGHIPFIPFRYGHIPFIPFRYGHIPFIPFIFGNPWFTTFHQPGANRSHSKGPRGCKKRTPEAGQDDEVLQSRDGWGMKCTMHTCTKNLPLEISMWMLWIYIYIMVDLFDFDITSSL